jgi:predicted RNA binding protein YcfA (HicA-like mRNA interferase family)
VSGKDVAKALEKGGYQLSHVRGSHHYYRGTTGLVCVPVHGNRDLPTGTLRSILGKVGLTLAELRELLK